MVGGWEALRSVQVAPATVVWVNPQTRIVCSTGGSGGQTAPLVGNTGSVLTGTVKLPEPWESQVVPATVPSVTSPAAGALLQVVLLVIQTVRSPLLPLQGVAPPLVSVQLTVIELLQSPLFADTDVL